MMVRETTVSSCTVYIWTFSNNLTVSNQPPFKVVEVGSDVENSYR
jgi:hypothetical protein